MGGASPARMPPHQPGAMTATSICFHETLQGAAASSYYRLILSKRAAVSPMIFCLSAEDSRGTLLIRPHRVLLPHVEGVVGAQKHLLRPRTCRSNAQHLGIDAIVSK